MTLIETTFLDQLPKWVTLSVRKQFQQRTENIPNYYEETIKQNNKQETYVELRIDGPYVKTIGTRDEIEAIFEINALLNAAFDEKDTMRLQKLGGIVCRAFSKDFCVYKLGPEPTDTKEFFETLQLITDDNIEMSSFGQVDTTNKIYQATVEAHYKVRFKNGSV